MIMWKRCTYDPCEKENKKDEFTKGQVPVQLTALQFLLEFWGVLPGAMHSDVRHIVHDANSHMYSCQWDFAHNIQVVALVSDAVKAFFFSALNLLAVSIQVLARLIADYGSLSQAT